MVNGAGSTSSILSAEQVRDLLASSLEDVTLDAKRVLVLIPDGTRTAPIPLMFRLLGEILGPRVARLDYLIALGTHQPMSSGAIDRLVGMEAIERAARYPNTAIHNHRWDQPEALTTIGTIGRAEAESLTGGLLAADVPVTLNRMIFDYDQLIICGPVFPHEVAGFSGGAKYLFPGIAGADIIHFTHWLGALVTSFHTIGIKETPVRRVIERAAAFVDRPILLLAMVLRGADLHGLYIGPHREAWSAAADLSARLNIVQASRRYTSVLSMPSEIYDDLWTAAKAMYKTEPAIADGGEVIIYAPHITEVSYTHGALIDAVGYHVRDYFTKQWERFKHVPGGILAHSTHVKGLGTYDSATGIETPRITVTLATGIPEARCRQINLGYRDYRALDPQAWAGREAEGRLLVPHAGEVLFRA
ncbi:MAG TPA: lactate racemase domain-containing protein [Anaerolineales bacterium]|nr:lactate racemase domain-containing protein [Anaerolineales bacterium]